MALADLWAFDALVAAFAAGAFGAAIGALPAFIFTGFTVIAGEAANLASSTVGEAAGIDPETLGTVGITSAIAFGPFFSPAISFGGGVAGAAYAAKKGYMDGPFDYHQGKNIAFAIGPIPDVMAVGGAFGIVGYWIQVLAAGDVLALPVDGIALGVVVSAGLARLVFGYDLVGKVRGDGPFDMSPFEREERRIIAEPAADGGDGVETDGGDGRFAVEPWLPHQFHWTHVAAIGAVVGALGGYTYLETGSTFLGFGISAASLVFLNCGVERVPVTHHMSLPGSAAAAAVTASGSGLVVGGPTLGIVVGSLFGLLGALSGEAFQRIFYAHGDTHWDPPAAGIVAMSFLIAVLAILGVFPGSSYVPTLGL